MRHKFTISVFVITVVLLIQALPLLELTPATAATARLGRVKGVITDINKARIVDARIILDGDHVHRNMRTNGEGEFEFSLLPGKYLLLIDAPGFRNYVSPEFQVKPGKTQRLNIELQITKPIGLTPAGFNPIPRESY